MISSKNINLELLQYVWEYNYSTHFNIDNVLLIKLFGQDVYNLVQQGNIFSFKVEHHIHKYDILIKKDSLKIERDFK